MSNIWEEEDNNNKWIATVGYKDSVYQVISRALADCMLQTNELSIDAAKQSGIIQFQNNIVATYNQSNWNAALLYNYLSYIINDRFNVRWIEKQGDEKNRNATQPEIADLEYVAIKVEEAYKGRMDEQTLHVFFRQNQ